MFIFQLCPVSQYIDLEENLELTNRRHVKLDMEFSGYLLHRL